MPTKKATEAADAVDAQLARYRTMRDFAVTAEPSGSAAPKSTTKAKQGLPFVIQKHAASHLHYDFRLGWNGVLKSWACAKGPSYVVKDRRLAVQVEDHPMEYGGFEGIIPAGQYGGGTVMVWDQGTWWPQPGHENVDQGLRDGSLKFVMAGSKMHGKWTLIRMNAKPGDKGSRWGNSTKPNWLLIKEHDEFERPETAPAVIDDSPNSAVTNRSLDQIATQEDHVWQSNKSAYLRDPSIKVPKDQPWHRQGPAKTAKGSSTKGKSVILSEATAHSAAAQSKDLPASLEPHSRSHHSTNSAKALAPDLLSRIKSLPKEPQPTFIKPQLALEATEPPDNSGWLHELKLDGYRIQARKSSSPRNKTAVQLLTRSGLDWTHRIPTLADAIAALPAKNITLDGEAVVLAPDGTTNFADLQASFQDGAQNPLTYFAFDLLHIEGHNPRNLPLIQRKALLTEVLNSLVILSEAKDLLSADSGDNPNHLIRLSEHLETSGPEMFRQACNLRAEGIVSKRADAPYRPGRSADWLKSKCLHEQEFVIGGFTLSSDGNDRIGSLLLGYYDDQKHLIYAGRTGTGFTQKLKRDLFTQLSALKLPKPVFDRVPTNARRGALWVEPNLVAQVRFATWTAEDLLRQAAFLGLREDKQPSEVRREEPAIAPKPKSAKYGDPKHGGNTAKVSSKTTSSTRLTHPLKVLDAESGLTKQQLADFYTAIADRILPHIANRPLSLVRCPEGTGKPCFFQKHINAMLPKDIDSIAVPDKKTGAVEQYISLSTSSQLVSLAQLGVLEIHPWGSQNDDLEQPDRLILDLDPDESIPWPTLCDTATEVRKRLKALGLASFLKLTGGKGLHIVAPIAPTLTWLELKTAAHKFVLSMERQNPKLYLTKMSKAARKQKIYLDYLRNERGATAVAPYSPRARAGAHVSLPLLWSALKAPTRPVFAVQNSPDWLNPKNPDPWKSLLSTSQQLQLNKFDEL